LIQFQLFDTYQSLYIKTSKNIPGNVRGVKSSDWLKDDEKHMIQKCINGDAYYEKKLYRLYVQAMYSRAVRMIGEEESAKDALQDAFIEVFKSLPKFRGESTLGVWIKKIVVHTCLKHQKQKKMISIENINKVAELDNQYEPDEQLITDMTSIHNAIKLLPDGCRNILNLYLLEGYQHQEIANIMNISESTSKTQYKRAKMILREYLKANRNE